MVLKTLSFLLVQAVFGFYLWYLLSPIASDLILVLIGVVYVFFTVVPLAGKILWLPVRYRDVMAWLIANLAIIAGVAIIITIHQSIPLAGLVLLISMGWFSVRVLFLGWLLH